MASNSMRRTATVFAAMTCLTLILSPWALAEDEASPAEDAHLSENAPPESSRPATDAASTAAAGLTIFIDPETGEVIDRPTTEQSAALSETLKTSMKRTADDLQPFELIHGGHGLHLEGRFRSATIVRTRPDGSLELRCAQHPDEVLGLLTKPAPAVKRALK